MTEFSNEIKIINAPQIITRDKDKAVDHLPVEDELGLQAEEHFGFAFFTKKPVEHLTAQIEELKGKIGTVVTSLSQSFAENAELDEVSIGLAVSIDGDIGIASAGAEASIELTFKVKH
jgi:hypothetical protein